MKTKRSAFNLIELTLAIAVVGIGIASIMALFVPAIDSTKNSIADNYAGDIVNSFTSYLEALARKGTNWNTFFSSGGLVYDPETQNKLPDPESSSLDVNEKKILNPAEWDENDTGMQTGIPGLYRLDSSNYRLFGVKAGNMFSGHIRVWAEKVTDFYVPGSSSTGDRELDLSKAARVYIELSWPATVKYENRNRRLYVTELYNY